jgi:hypothetical protein
MGENRDENQPNQRARRRPGQSAKFYTNLLGFVKKADVPVGEYR